MRLVYLRDRSVSSSERNEPDDAHAEPGSRSPAARRFPSARGDDAGWDEVRDRDVEEACCSDGEHDRQRLLHAGERHVTRPRDEGGRARGEVPRERARA